MFALFWKNFWWPILVIKKLNTSEIASEARLQNVGGGAPITKSRRRRPQIVGGTARAEQSSNRNYAKTAPLYTFEIITKYET